MRTFILLTALTSLAAMPAHAADPVKKSRPKLICKGERVIGSNLTKRLCMTKERWDEERRKAKDAMDFTRPVPVQGPREGG